MLNLVKDLFQIAKDLYFLWVAAMIVGAISGYFLTLDSGIILLILGIIVVCLMWNLPYGTGLYVAVTIFSFFADLLLSHWRLVLFTSRHLILTGPGFSAKYNKRSPPHLET